MEKIVAVGAVAVVATEMAAVVAVSVAAVSVAVVSVAAVVAFERGCRILVVNPSCLLSLENFRIPVDMLMFVKRIAWTLLVSGSLCVLLLEANALIHRESTIG